MSIATKIQIGIVVITLLFVGGFFAWMKVKPRSALGGPCGAAIDCVEGTEYCLKPVSSEQGVCTKQCETDADCGNGLVCEKTDIVETIQDADGDVSQNNWNMGYCFQP